MTYAMVGVHGRSEAITLTHDVRDPRLGVGQPVTLGWALEEGGKGGFGGDKSRQCTVHIHSFNNKEIWLHSS